MNGVGVDIEGMARKFGMIAIILVGAFCILSGVLLYITALFGFEYAPELLIFIIPATAVIVFAIFAIICGINLDRRTLESKHIFRAVITYLISIITLCILGIIFAAISPRLVPLWAPIIAMIGSILLIIAASIYRSPDSRVIGGVMGIIGVSLLVAGSGFLGTEYGTGASLASIGGLGAWGIVACIVVAVGALLYPFLERTKYKSICFIILVAGALLYGIGLTIAGFSSISRYLEFGGLRAVIGSITFIFEGITGIFILIASSLGITHFGLSFSQTFVPTLKCPKCGAPYKVGDTFCKSCGANLMEGKPVAPSAEAKQFCPGCSSPVRPDMEFCPNCGAKLK